VALFVEDRLIHLDFVIMSLTLEWALPAVKYFDRTGSGAHRDTLQSHLGASLASGPLADILLGMALQGMIHMDLKVEVRH
jgi:hypothetical protein